jgi:HTH-type transcriptional regulator/antitoxin HigA
MNDSPIIALSLRFDRIDNLWHNVFHELFHILNNDGYRLDLEPDDETPIDEIDEVEKRANDESADALIPTGVLDSFIRRVSPFYRRERIIQFANRNKIHPGIVIGQLQHRKEISWKSNKEFLVNVRDIIKKTALTDGWGCTIGRSER